MNPGAELNALDISALICGCVNAGRVMVLLERPLRSFYFSNRTDLCSEWLTTVCRVVFEASSTQLACTAIPLATGRAQHCSLVRRKHSLLMVCLGVSSMETVK